MVKIYIRLMILVIGFMFSSEARGQWTPNVRVASSLKCPLYVRSAEICANNVSIERRMTYACDTLKSTQYFGANGAIVAAPTVWQNGNCNKSDCTGNQRQAQITGTATLTIPANTTCSFSISVTAGSVTIAETGSPTLTLTSGMSGSQTIGNATKFLTNQITVTGTSATARAFIFYMQ